MKVDRQSGLDVKQTHADEALAEESKGEPGPFEEQQQVDLQFLRGYLFHSRGLLLAQHRLELAELACPQHHVDDHWEENKVQNSYRTIKVRPT